ncbi:MAG TPA: DNA cytosine methyltransferase, partial [Cyanophyceae cyanobacterium]
MTHYDGISLCTGILGFELGMVIAGISNHINIRQCVEINPYCQELIRLRLPGVPIWDDLATYVPPSNLESDRTIIWSGFPCQPVSQAGKQRGDADKRYLWPHILRLIRQVRPVVWVGENVSGLRTIDAGRLFRGILEDLSR